MKIRIFAYAGVAALALFMLWPTTHGLHHIPPEEINALYTAYFRAVDEGYVKRPISEFERYPGREYDAKQYRPAIWFAYTTRFITVHTDPRNTVSYEVHLEFAEKDLKKVFVQKYVNGQ
jgi:hypothetical protein